MEPFGVLLIDDSDDLRRLLELNLSLIDLPWQIHHARGPEELARIEPGLIPHVVVVDGGYSSREHPPAGMMARQMFPSSWIVSFSGTPGSHPWADASILKGTPDALDQVIDTVRWVTRSGVATEAAGGESGRP